MCSNELLRAFSSSVARFLGQQFLFWFHVVGRPHAAVSDAAAATTTPAVAAATAAAAATASLSICAAAAPTLATMRVQEMGESGTGSIDPGIASGECFWMASPDLCLQYYYDTLPDKNGPPATGGTPVVVEMVNNAELPVLKQNATM